MEGVRELPGASILFLHFFKKNITYLYAESAALKRKKKNLFFYLFNSLAVPAACGSSQARDQTHGLAATISCPAVTMLDL